MLDSRLNPVEAKYSACEICGTFKDVAMQRFYSVANRSIDSGMWCPDCYLKALMAENRMCAINFNKNILDKVSKSNKEIASMVGVSPRTVEGWKQGRKIKASTMFKISKIIGGVK